MQSSHCKCTPFCSLVTPSIHHLCFLESSWEFSDVVGQLAVVAQELDICTIDQDPAPSLLLHVFFTAERSEAPVLGNDNLLATRELVLRSTESLESGSFVYTAIRINPVGDRE
jgi:hypothetical protein